MTMTTINFGKSPEWLAIDFSAETIGVTTRLDRHETRHIKHSKGPLNAFERRVLEAAVAAKATITCSSCKMFLAHCERCRCSACGQNALEVIGARLVTQLDDVWMQPAVDNLDSMRDHQARLLWAAS